MKWRLRFFGETGMLCINSAPGVGASLEPAGFRLNGNMAGFVFLGGVLVKVCWKSNTAV